MAITKFRRVSAYTLISPHLERLSVFLASKLIDNRLLVGEAMQFIGMPRNSFFFITLRYTLPAMVAQKRRKNLDEIAGIVQDNLGVLLVHEMAGVLAQIFLIPQDYTSSLYFLEDVLRSQAHDNSDLSPKSIVNTSVVPFAVILLIDFGDNDPAVRRAAKIGLERAYHVQDPANSADLSEFLKPHMLGIVSQLNDALHDLQGKKTVEYKRKIIRSMGRLINTIGDSMSTFSPQVSASITVAD